MIDRRLSAIADAFIEKYYNDEYIIDYQKAEQLTSKRPNGINLLKALGGAISDYEGSKFLSAAGEPYGPSMMLLLSLVNEALSSGVLVSKSGESVGMNSGKGFVNEVKDFLAKLCEMSNYDTKKPVDVYEVDAKLNLEEGKTEQLANYSLGKKWIMEPDRTFDRVNTGDPVPSRKFRSVFVTSEGIDKKQPRKGRMNYQQKPEWG